MNKNNKDIKDYLLSETSAPNSSKPILNTKISEKIISDINNMLNENQNNLSGGKRKSNKKVKKTSSSKKKSIHGGAKKSSSTKKVKKASVKKSSSTKLKRAMPQFLVDNQELVKFIKNKINADKHIAVVSTSSTILKNNDKDLKKAMKWVENNSDETKKMYNKNVKEQQDKKDAKKANKNK
jgi:hypothetical protein